MRNLQMGKLTNNRAARWGAIFALALGWAAAPNRAAAQQASAPQVSTPQASTPAANSSADVPVHLVVTVEPRHGGAAPALGADDVKVFQHNDQDQVTGWIPLQGDRAGLQLFILIDDNSRSVFGPAIQRHCKIHPGAAGQHRDRRGLHAEWHGVHRAEFDQGPCPGRQVAAFADRARSFHQPVPVTGGPDEAMAGNRRTPGDINVHQRSGSTRRRIFE